ncbi:hypothetical protein [Maricaulis maris]|uniref:hypothetical protein n=1 Tax=Maricaulis maris TaxID=74318 RepID=UPI003B8BEC1C
MMNDREADPFSVLATPDETWTKGRGELWHDAIKAFDPTAPEPLIRLLRNPCSVTAMSGLYIFGELGRKASGALGAALAWHQHPSEAARANLLQGVNDCWRDLTARQLSQILPLLTDDSYLVRQKMLTVLVSVDTSLIESAIGLIECEEERSQHLSGFMCLRDPKLDVQSAFEEALSSDRLMSAYLMANILRRARFDEDAPVPKYDGSADFPKSVVDSVKVMKDRARRRRVRRGKRDKRE